MSAQSLRPWIGRAQHQTRAECGYTFRHQVLIAVLRKDQQRDAIPQRLARAIHSAMRDKQGGLPEESELVGTLGRA